MISQRAARPSGSVERLRQLSLSNLRGVDETRAPTDRYSVFSATNFVNNLDGSFSLRKPLLIKRDWTKLVKSIPNLSDGSIVVNRIVPLYTESDCLILFKIGNDSCFTLYNCKANSFVEKCVLKWRDADGVEHTKTLFNNRDEVEKTWYTSTKGLTDLSAGSVFHANTATNIGNCNVNLTSEWFDEHPMCNVDLYDATFVSGVQTVHKPRYIQFYRDNLNVWYFNIHNPVVNVFEANADTGTYEHPLDTLLDSMYALRDEYTSVVPAVKQIVPYVYTDLHENTIKPVVISTSSNVKDDITTSSNIELAATSEYYALANNLGVTYAGTPVTVLSIENVCEVSAQVTHVLRKQFDNELERIWEVTLKLEVRALTYLKSVKFDTSKSAIVDFVEHRIDESRRLGTVNVNGVVVNGIYELQKGSSATQEVKLTTFHLVPIAKMEYAYANVRWPIRVDVTTIYERNVSTVSVGSVTESFRTNKFRGSTVLPKGGEFTCILKAFCNFPNNLSDSKYYATWLYTLDGRSWQNMISLNDSDEMGFKDGTVFEEQSELPIKSVNVSKEDELPKVSVTYAPFKSVDGIEDTKRIDMLKISKNFLENHFTNAAFRFKIVLVEDNKIVATYGQADYIPVRDTEGQYWHSELGNSVLGEKVFHKGRIFSFGDASFKNNVFVSYPGEFVTPFKNTINVNASEDVFVTAVVPWKDYLVLTTPQAIYLASQVESGYLTKTVNTSLGVTVHDAGCITPTLNGIILKSESKVYMLYPNIYAGDDSVINVTEISKPVENFLFEHEPNPDVKPFAFGTEAEYVLVLPEESCSKCLVYNYTTKLWNCLQFPVVFQYHVMYSLTDIVLFGNSPDGSFCEYSFNKSFAEAYGLTDSQIDYGDVLVEPEDGIGEGIADVIAGYVSPITVSPIEFELDTGQKSDQILTKKQFVETKIVIATSTEAPSVNMEVLVHVDGDPNITKDISTDSTFWKSYEGGGVLNTGSHGLSNSSDVRNILRQLVLRYSGKGNSVRHILKGTASSNFKLYETYIRYKLLNVKQ